MSKKTYPIADCPKYFKPNGRIETYDGGITCDSTACGIEFKGEFKADVTIELSCSKDTYFTLYVDGVRLDKRLYANESTVNLTVANFDAPGSHSLRLLKQTEPQLSLCLLKSVTVDGILYPAPENRKKYIEFIGDSISCGYGNLGDKGSEDPGCALWEDGTDAFAFLTAEILGADCSVISSSGIGVGKGWSPHNICDFYSKQSFYRNGEKLFEPSRIPDLAVINLGTNDKVCKCEKEPFFREAKRLLNTVREFYGCVKILWVYNMMGDGRTEWVLEVLKEMGGEQNGFYSARLDSDHSGANGHPGADAHRRAAKRLAEIIDGEKLL